MLRHGRSLLALLLALAAHAVAFVLLLALPAPPATDTVRVSFELARPPAVEPVAARVVEAIVPPPKPRARVTPPPPAPAPPATADPSPPVASDPAPAEPVADDAAPAEAVAEGPPAPASPAGPRALTSDPLLERVLDKEQPRGLVADLGTLEDAIPHKAPGPMSDKQRLEGELNGFFKGALAASDVRRGMVDDWFRDVGKGIERQWRPHARDLNDPSQGTRAGILGRFATNPKEWAEYGPLYIQDVLGLMQRDTAKDPTLAFTPDPTAPTVSGQTEGDERARLAQLRKLLAENKQALRYIARARVVVHHRADGRIDSIELVNPSGHERIDEGMVHAVERALLAVGARLPTRDRGGAAPTSEWLLSAVWQVTPVRCAALDTVDGMGPLGGQTRTMGCGAKWDITPDGVEVEKPLELKLHTDVELLGVHD